ncbi:Molybdenum cofactor sulfurase [Balamuthia mandrillaris]
MFVDGNHTFLSQRRFPQMATVRTTQLPGHSLQLDAPNMEPLLIPCPSSPSSNNNNNGDDEVQVDVWDNKVSAVDQGEAAASWISTYLDTMGARLVKMGPSFQRMAHPSIPGPQVSFADDGPILLVSEPSLRDLNERLTQNGNAAVPVDRFRANIVVRQEEGDDGDELKPYGEDEWLVVEIGEVKFMVYKACSRCQIIGINQQTGEEVKRGGPLAALRRYRARGGNIAYADFGQLMMQLNEGKLKVGDEVKILERKQQ